MRTKMSRLADICWFLFGFISFFSFSWTSIGMVLRSETISHLKWRQTKRQRVEKIILYMSCSFGFVYNKLNSQIIIFNYSLLQISVTTEKRTERNSRYLWHFRFDARRQIINCYVFSLSSRHFSKLKLFGRARVYRVRAHLSGWWIVKITELV